MIQHDYLLRLIEQFLRSLGGIGELRQGRQPGAADAAVAHEIQALLAVDRATLLQLSTTEVLARLLRSGTALEAQNKLFFVVALLKESGDLAETQGAAAEARRCRLQALRLLLESPNFGPDLEYPQFAPTVEGLTGLLAEAPLPTDLQARLMAHHEANGDFGKAEDALFTLLDATDDPPAALEFGRAFYGRLLTYHDDTLAAGGLPRAEVVQGLADLRARTA